MLAGFKDGEKNIKAFKSGKLLELNMVNRWFHNVSEKQLLKQLFVHVGAAFFFVRTNFGCSACSHHRSRHPPAVVFSFFMLASLDVGARAEVLHSLRDGVRDNVQASYCQNGF
jgi:hypothetical protein